MLGVILSICIMASGVYLLCKKYSFIQLVNKSRRIDCLDSLGIIALFAGGILLGVTLLAPINGYNEPVAKAEFDLSPIYVDETGEEIYALKSDTGEYLIQYINEDNKIITEIITCDLQQDVNYKTPIKRIYNSKPKPNIWSLGLTGEKEYSVIIIESNSISYSKNNER